MLYGNVGATDRLDFTVIGPAVNEAARIEALCEPLGRAILVSAEFVAAAMDDDSRLEPLGRHALRGVREAKEIFALDLGAAASLAGHGAVRERRPTPLISLAGTPARRMSSMTPGPLGKIRRDCRSIRPIENSRW